MAGLVTRADGTALQILTTARETITVTLDEHTSYLKWITHKPRQQDNRVKSGSLGVLLTDEAGTVDDPCRVIR